MALSLDFFLKKGIGQIGLCIYLDLGEKMCYVRIDVECIHHQNFGEMMF